MLDHIPGGDLLDPVLEELVDAPGGFLTTEELRRRLRTRFKLPGQLGAILADEYDDRFDAHLLHLVSGQRQHGGSVSSGRARFEADRNGWAITVEGQDYVKGVVG